MELMDAKQLQEVILKAVDCKLDPLLEKIERLEAQVRTFSAAAASSQRFVPPPQTSTHAAADSVRAQESSVILSAQVEQKAPEELLTYDRFLRPQGAHKSFKIIWWVVMLFKLKPSTRSSQLS